MRLEKYLNKNWILYIITKWINAFNCVPIKAQFNHGEFRFSTKSKSEISNLTQRTYFNYCAALVQFLQIYLKAKQGIRSSDLVIGLFALLAILATTSFINICRKNGRLWEEYQNNLFAFQEKYNRKKEFKKHYNAKHFALATSTIETLNMLFVPGFVVTGALLPFMLVLGVHWSNPCKPSLLGYFILKECFDEADNLTGLFRNACAILVKLIVYVVNLWVWSFGENGCHYIFVSLLMFGAMMTRESIEMFWQQYKHSTNIYRDALVYRQLQIINILGNVLQKSCLGLFICVVTLAFSMNFSLLIGSISGQQQESNIIMVLMFAAVSSNTMALLLVLLGGMVEVHKQSKYTIEAGKRLKSTHTKYHGWTKRFWKSCPILKTKFGYGSFLEELTPLRCVDLGFGLTVQFLLLSTSR